MSRPALTEETSSDENQQLTVRMESQKALATLPSGASYARFWQRFLAFTADQLNLAIISILILLFAMVAATASSAWCLPAVARFVEQLPVVPSPNAGLATLLLSGIIIGLLPWLYVAFYESSAWRATPGKRMLNLIVVDDKGNSCGFWKSTYKLFIQAVLLYCLGIIFGSAAHWLVEKSPLTEVFATQPVVYLLFLKPFSCLTEMAITLAAICLVLFNGRQTLIDRISGRLVIHVPERKATSKVKERAASWTLSSAKQLAMTLALCLLPFAIATVLTFYDNWSKLDAACCVDPFLPSRVKERPPFALRELAGGSPFIQALYQSESELGLTELVAVANKRIRGFSKIYARCQYFTGRVNEACGLSEAAILAYTKTLLLASDHELARRRWARLLAERDNTLTFHFSPPVVSSGTTGSTKESDLLGSARIAEAKGNLALAHQYLHELRREAADHPEAKALRSFIWLEESDSDRCLRAASELHALRPMDSTPYALAACALLSKKMPEQGLSAAIRAVTLAPDSAYAHAALAEALVFNGMPQLGLEQSELAVSIDPHSADGFLQLAHSKRLLCQLESAGGAINKALSLRPNDSRILKEQAELLLRQGDTTKWLALRQKLTAMGHP